MCIFPHCSLCVVERMYLNIKTFYIVSLVIIAFLLMTLFDEAMMLKEEVRVCY